MTPRAFSSAMRAALKAQGLERQDGRWYVRSDELIWTVAPERDRFASRYYIGLSCLVRELSPEVDFPEENQGHVITEYAFVGNSMPPDCKDGRFNDHESYFTMAFDLTHALINDAERSRAIDWAAKDIARLVKATSTVRELKSVVARKLGNAFVHAELQSLWTVRDKLQPERGPTA